jgi:flavorubredoxin
VPPTPVRRGRPGVAGGRVLAGGARATSAVAGGPGGGPPCTVMARLLVVHHTASPNLQAMFEAVIAGATDPAIEGVAVVTRPALAATPVDVMEADGYVLGTPANLGYMSGALKHFFDQVYYPCLESTIGRPFGVYVHGNNDTTGALRAIEMITTGLQWRLAQQPVTVIGAPTTADTDACWELGAALAAFLTELA